MVTNVSLPQWLDKYIFSSLNAKYCRSNSDMSVIDWDKKDMLNYLGTYFPRSYTESYCIWSDWFRQPVMDGERKTHYPYLTFVVEQEVKSLVSWKRQTKICQISKR